MERHLSKDRKRIRVQYDFCGIRSIPKMIPIEHLYGQKVAQSPMITVASNEGSSIPTEGWTEFMFEFRGNYAKGWGGDLPLMELKN